jgi:hypothetical protein
VFKSATTQSASVTGMPLSPEASQGPPGERAPRRLPSTETTFFAKFNMRDGLVREIRMSSNTPFYKLKRALCEREGLSVDEVCVFFEGKELQADQRTGDVEMRNGAVVSFIERKLVYPTLEPRTPRAAAPVQDFENETSSSARRALHATHLPLSSQSLFVSE